MNQPMTKTPVGRWLLPCALVLGTGHAVATRLADLDLTVIESDIEPRVTIQEHPNRVVEEYSVNNKTYMIKITPSAGAPYYLIDDDGSGDLEYRRGAGGRDIRVPQWVLFSW
jgi:hypothetical protein